MKAWMLAAALVAPAAMAEQLSADKVLLMTCMKMDKAIPAEQRIPMPSEQECILVRHAKGVPDSAEPKVGAPRQVELQRAAQEPHAGLPIEERKLLLCMGKDDKIVPNEMIPIPTPAECLDLRHKKGISDFPADGYSKVDMTCRYQAMQIEEAYRLYQGGASEDETVQGILRDGLSLDSRMWAVQMVRNIFKDSRSMFVNAEAGIIDYFGSCRSSPDAYIKDKRLIR